MSRFREARQQAEQAARKRAFPSPLQLAWLAVLLTFGGVIIWLSLTPPPTATSPTQVAAAAKPEQTPAAPVPAAKPAEPSPAADATPAKMKPAEPAKPAAQAPAPAAKPQAVVAITPPQDDLLEQTPNGPLPKIGSNGREPWQVYARPFQDTTKPRIAIVIAGVGLNKLLTDTAIETLPANVTLAFSPYGTDLVARSEKARRAGHELALLVPMEPHDYPKNDPGPHSLLTTLTLAENKDRLHWVLSRFPGYVGVVNDMGSRFTSSEDAMKPFLEELKARGLLFMDARTSQYSVGAKLARGLRVPRAVNNRYIDNTATEAEIRTRLEELENLAQTYGAAAGIGRPYPVTLKTVTAWAEKLSERGFELVPLTAVANRQPVR